MDQKQWQKIHTFRAWVDRERKQVQIHDGFKWRNIDHFGGKNLPPKKKQDEIRHRIWLNTGRRLNESEITLVWE